MGISLASCPYTALLLSVLKNKNLSLYACYVYAYMYIHVLMDVSTSTGCASYSTHVEDIRKSLMLVLTLSRLRQGLLLAVVYPRIAGLWMSRDLPISTFYFKSEALRLQVCVITSGFSWVLGI